jgi:hypothetical protein
MRGYGGDRRDRLCAMPVRWQPPDERGRSVTEDALADAARQRSQSTRRIYRPGELVTRLGHSVPLPESSVGRGGGAAPAVRDTQQ